MNIMELQSVWQNAYGIVPQQLEKIKDIKRVVTAFNTNIDAVLKINGKRLTELADKVGLQTNDLLRSEAGIDSAQDVIRGIIKCFTQGIAEEWLCERQAVYEWMRDNLGYDRLQMGGQGGIVANALALSGVQEVCAHTASHPRLQAKQFLDLDNLKALDENGEMRKATNVDRASDLPLIHWIIEFDKDDTFVFGGKTYQCPKANRFIATYDIANLNLQINSSFVQYVNKNGYDYMILSGYHNLTSARDGVQKVKSTVSLIKQWKKQFPQGIIHLELASTQDKEVRKAIIEEIAPLSDSIGLNDREALDVLEIIDAEKYASVYAPKVTAPQMFEVLNILRQHIKAPRIQLHIFGLYITLQNNDFRLNAEQNKRGMMLASTIAATKAGIGKLENYADLLWASQFKVAEHSLLELEALAKYLHDENMVLSGILQRERDTVIAVPTILIEKPLTLVGMGDTISSISLLGAR
ncbi:MAG: ADP-dependent glucokinase/phosphofructokinase [Alphaproteobacteria bacterium]|nr:ADP-dependent glucokinase/phosphofructokinase [Alphaproteobacteria bacterium]